MSLPLLIQGLGSIGIFSSRAFLPAFATALLLRFGPQVPWLTHTGLLQHIRGVPTWFTSDANLVILGLLTVLELIAERVPEAKAFLDEIHDYLKTGMAVLTCLFNQTGQWTFRFCATKRLARRLDHPDYLVVMHRVPVLADGSWRDRLEDAIKDVFEV